MVAVIYVGGTGPSAPPALPAAPLTRIAADGGLDLAVTLGADVDLVVGDLDSVSAEALAVARARGVEVRESPVDKDETDLELAIACAEELGASQLVVIGGGGGRLDHLLGVLAALAGAARRGLDVAAYPGDDLIWFVAPGVHLELSIRPGRTVSLVPVGGPATGVHAAGLTWPLTDATLDPFQAIGVSNCAEADEVVVQVTDGVVAVIAPRPEAAEPCRSGDSRPRADPNRPVDSDPPDSPSATFRRIPRTNPVPGER